MKETSGSTRNKAKGYKSAGVSILKSGCKSKLLQMYTCLHTQIRGYGENFRTMRQLFD